MQRTDEHQDTLEGIVEEFTRQLRQGERPAISEFTARRPELRADIEELLTSVAMIEELKFQSNSNANSLKLEMKEILKLDRIGDYRIVGELGRGGMGVVFEAVHESLGRRVAIKVMPNRTFDDQKYLERFKREAQAAANLHHTNIVSVFGMGQVGEHHYYVMEYVDGECLSAILARINGRRNENTEKVHSAETIPKTGGVKLRTQQVPGSGGKASADRVQLRANVDSPRQRYRWAARIGLQIADGLAYAHGLGTLHRDIKPSNLLVDRNDTVWLTDFGLVKNISNQSITKTGDIIGTPQYMAPESFEGQYDERSETYCLGLTLYEMVTLQPAYDNVSTPELIRRITTTSPVAPRRLDSGIPRDLSRIIEKAISREPSYRYKTAADIRDDLLAFLDDRPISVRRISMTENIWRWSRRNPLSATLALATGLMVCLVAVAASIALTISNQALTASNEKTTSLQVQKRVASYAQKRAEANIDFTVGLFDRMFTGLVLKDREPGSDVSLDGFNQLTGLSTTVSETDAVFLDQMLRFYMDFAEQNKENVTLRTLAAKSFRRVANIHQLTGDLESAIAAYGRSIQIYESLNQESPKNIPLVLTLARTLNEKGQAIESQGTPGSWNAAIAEYRRAELALCEHSGFDSMELQFELAKTLVFLGSPQTWQKPELPQRFASLFGRQKNTPFGIKARASGGYPESMIRVVRPIHSLEALEQAIKITDTLVAMHPKRDEIQLLKAMALTRLAGLQAATRNHRAAKESLREAEAVLEELQRQDPDNPDYRFVLAQIQATPIRLKSEEAIEALAAAKETMIGLAAKHDRNLEYRQLLANVGFRLGRLYEDSADPENALRNFRFANGLFQEIQLETPRSRQIQLTGFVCLLQLVDLQIRNGEPEAAVRTLEQAIRNADGLPSRKPGEAPSFVMIKAGMFGALASVHQDAGNSHQAAKAKKAQAMLLESRKSSIVNSGNVDRPLSGTPD